MKRRDFLKTAGAGSAVVAGTLAAPAISQGREKMTMVTAWGRGLAGVWDACQIGK
jgi:TRAP-type mannitol/chloroaromatic compound transport system substrate-binding protein|tara:strand:+ start:2045 stop:2209 length:165 start_codon:yes stop_codon:yes gene_type:complete